MPDLPDPNTVERARRSADDAAQAAYDRSPEVREIVERGLAAPLENMHPRTPRRRKI